VRETVGLTLEPTIHERVEVVGTLTRQAALTETNLLETFEIFLCVRSGFVGGGRVDDARGSGGRRASRNDAWNGDGAILGSSVGKSDSRPGDGDLSISFVTLE
jgi:hypothetical protein